MSTTTNTPSRRQKKPDIKLLALDMDGTLLNSQSLVDPTSVEAIKAAISRDVTVMLATGKARPAAMNAMKIAGLAGEGLLVSHKDPGVFLQGLMAYGPGGKFVTGGQLDVDIARRAFEFAEQHNVPICGFLGDTCMTIRMHPELEELHHRYYEPLAEVMPSVDAAMEVLQGGNMPLRKLLFMTSVDRVDNHLKPHWDVSLYYLVLLLNCVSVKERDDFVEWNSITNNCVLNIYRRKL